MPDYTTSVGSLSLDGGTITGNVTVESGKTIDGVDVGAHLHTGSDGTGKVDIANLDNVSLATPAVDQVLKYNGADWVNSAGLVASAGRGTIFYYDDTNSDVTSNETLARIPDVVQFVDEPQTVNNSTEMIDTYASASGGLGVTQVNAGVWTFNSYTYVSTTDGVTKLRYIVHKIDNATPWAETQLFSVDSDEITTVGTTEADAVVYTTTTTQPAFAITETQRLKIEVWATTDNVGDVVVHFVHSGSYTSNVETPLPTKHNDLAGLEGGNGEFYHSTLTEYTGTGTGNFVRAAAPTITGNLVVDRIGIGDTPTSTYKINIKQGHIKMQQVESPATAPSVALGAAGVLTGDYYYRVAYVTAIGETATGPASGKISPSSQKVELTDIPLSEDTSVTSVEIYRTLNGGTIYDTYMVAEITRADLISAGYAYTDNSSDASISGNERDVQINNTGGLIYVNTHLTGVADETTTVWGRDALANGTGYFNTAVGVEALKTNAHGDSNTAVGHQSAYSNTTGTNNVAVGCSALYANTTGTYNIAVGCNSLIGNTTGTNNTAVGADALQDNTTGIQNTGVGNNTAWHTTTGNQNTAIGDGALANNTTGSNNTAVGQGALQGKLSSYTADYNIAVGCSSMAETTTGDYNIAIGRDALDANVTGVRNVAIGGQNTLVACTGSQNVAVGFAAGATLTSGTRNVFIGHLAGNDVAQKVDATNSIAIGYDTWTTASNQIVLGSTAITETLIRGTITGPTISKATFAAGTATAGTAPIKLTSGTLLTVPEAGTFEYDGLVFYETNATGRGVTAAKRLSIIQTPLTLANDATVQQIFPTTNDVFTYSASTTYIVRGVLYITGGDGTNHTVGLAFTVGGGGSLTNIAYTTRATHIAVANTVVSTAADRAWITQSTMTTATSNGKGPTIIQLDGIIRTNVAGTITPQLQFNTAPNGTTPTVGMGSYMEFMPIGTNTMTSVGPWA